MGLYLLNISVDSADPNPEHIPEDLSFNDQESVVEIVVEKVLGYENAIEEYDDHDTEDHNKKGSNIKIDLVVHFTLGTGTSRPYHDKQEQNFPQFEAHIVNGFHQIDTPPPKI